jgi:AcrR family transcriptional regulator
MDRTSVPAEGAKLRLVAAAEELFAGRGFEAVSVRDITKHANMNIASVNYHFGSRDGLVAAAMIRHLTPVFEERLVRLHHTERGGGPGRVLVRGLLESWIGPVVEHTMRSHLPNVTAGKLLGRMLSEQAAGMPPTVVALGKQAFALALRILGRALPGAQEHELALRMHFLNGSLAYVLAWPEVLERDAEGVVAKPKLPSMIAELVSFGTAGLGEGEQAESPAADQDSQGLFDF